MRLLFTPLSGPAERRTPNGPGTLPLAARSTRIVAGHPEAFLEAFANIYTGCAELITAKLEGRDPDPDARLVPGVEDGARGVRFIAAAVEASPRGGVWTPLDLAL